MNVIMTMVIVLILVSINQEAINVNVMVDLNQKIMKGTAQVIKFDRNTVIISH